jgi:2-desacetyl-2-hydroxyethyl bacteriochlorophyllide A dehydrogenase
MKNKTMAAIIYNGVKDIAIEERAVPLCGADDVVVRNVRAGICGSDVTAYLYGGQYAGVFPGREFGHEMAGYVCEVGSNVKDVTEGLRVFINPVYCQPNPSESDMAGAFSQYVRVQNAKINYNLFVLPDTLSFDDAVLIEPFSVGTHGKNRPRAKAGDHVLIFGAGTIGLCALNSLIAQGNKNVALLDVDDKRLAIAWDMGAAVYNPQNGALVDFLTEHFGEAKRLSPGKAVDVDVVIDCAAAPNIPADFLSWAKPGARLSCVGVHKNEVPVNFRQIMSTEAEIMGSRGYTNDDIFEVISNLSKKNSRITDIVTHRFNLRDAHTAFETAADPDVAIKVVFEMEEAA